MTTSQPLAHIGGSVAGNGALFPRKPALICDDDSIDWGTLADAVGRLSAWIARETPEGAGVAVSLPNCTALPALVLAIAGCGRQAQILDPAWPRTMAQSVVSGLDSALVLATDAALGPPCRTIVLPERAGLPDLDRMCSAPSPFFPDAVDPERPFYVGFTSGSTGVPKGYRRNHRSWIESFSAEALEFGHTSQDAIIAPGNLSHSLFLYAVMHALHRGATAVMARQFRPERLADLVATHGGAILYAAPAQLALLARTAQMSPGGRTEQLRWIVASGAKWNWACRDTLRQMFPGARFAEFYGASELSFVSVAREDEHPLAGCVGRAFAGVEIAIRGEDGRPAPTMASGLVWVRSPMIFDGYVYPPDARALQPSADGFYCVGDTGWLDERGRLFLVGRNDRMIVTAGKNLFPEEIETVLEAHEAVEAAAVVAMNDERRGARPVALVRLVAGATVCRADLIAYARAALPLYKVPRRYLAVDDWPRTRSGKSDFAMLEANLLAGQYRPLS